MEIIPSFSGADIPFCSLLAFPAVCCTYILVPCDPNEKCAYKYSKQLRS